MTMNVDTTFTDDILHILTDRVPTPASIPIEFFMSLPPAVWYEDVGAVTMFPDFNIASIDNVGYIGTQLTPTLAGFTINASSPYEVTHIASSEGGGNASSIGNDGSEKFNSNFSFSGSAANTIYSSLSGNVELVVPHVNNLLGNWLFNGNLVQAGNINCGFRPMADQPYDDIHFIDNLAFYGNGQFQLRTNFDSGEGAPSSGDNNQFVGLIKRSALGESAGDLLDADIVIGLVSRGDTGKFVVNGEVVETWTHSSATDMREMYMEWDTAVKSDSAEKFNTVSLSVTSCYVVSIDSSSTYDSYTDFTGTVDVDMSEAVIAAINDADLTGIGGSVVGATDGYWWPRVTADIGSDVGPAMEPIFLDALVEGSSTALTSHTPDDGGTWTSGTLITVNGTGASTTSTSSRTAVSDVPTPTGNFELKFKFIAPAIESGAWRTKVYFEDDGSTAFGAAVRWLSGISYIDLYEFSGSTNMDSFAGTPSVWAGVEHEVKLTYIDGDTTIYFDGVSVGTSNTAVPPEGGFLRFELLTTVASTPPLYLTHIEISTEAAPGPDIPSLMFGAFYEPEEEITMSLMSLITASSSHEVMLERSMSLQSLIAASSELRINGTYGMSTISTATLGSAFGMQRDIVMAFNSQGSLQSVLTLERNKLMSLMSEMQAESAFAVNGIFGVNFTSELNMQSLQMLTVNGLPDFDGGVIWVVNLDTGASSQYEQYNFNSFLSLDGVDYGVASDGIYKLEGDDDNGEEIKAVAVLPKSDFGDSRIKHVPHFYAGIASTGQMILKVEADGKTYYYDAKGSSETLKNQRFDIGKGLDGTYWQLTLLNRDGCDFDLDSIEWTPAARQRRIGS
jgi:hypothetical protein